MFLDESYANVNDRPGKILHDTSIKSHHDIEDDFTTSGIPRPSGVGQRLIIVGVGNENGWLINPLIYKRMYNSKKEKPNPAAVKLLKDLNVTQLKEEMRKRHIPGLSGKKEVLVAKLKVALEADGINVDTYDFKDPSESQDPEPSTALEVSSKSVSADYHDDMDSEKFEIYLEECCKALNEGIFRN